MIADDLFAGAGGWDLAAAQLGIHARGVENMKEARATRDAAGLTTIHDDVWTFKPRYLGRNLTAQGLIASPPCQTFSAAGKGSGRKALAVVQQLAPHVGDYTLKQLKRIGMRATGDERTALVLTPLWFAVHHPYEWLAWEQVPTVLPVWQVCAEVLRGQGFSVWTGLLQAEMFGVPQTRKRAFLLASRVGPVAAPIPTHSRYYSRDPQKLDMGVEKWVSMAEALGWTEDGVMRSNYGTGGDASARGERLLSEPAPTVTPKVDRNQIRFAGAGQTSEQTSGQIPRNLDQPAHTITGKGTAAWVLRMTKQENSAVRPADHPAPTIAFGHDAASARWFRGDEWMFHRPSTTIVGSFKPEIVAAPGTTVSRQNAPNSVRVTVQEAGVLQSFPADFPWQGAKGKQFLQAGNAVPPGLAMHALMAASGVETAIEEVA
jgi:DNA (cytosine-5)-methyltransferase 1